MTPNKSLKTLLRTNFSPLRTSLSKQNTDDSFRVFFCRETGGIFYFIKLNKQKYLQIKERGTTQPLWHVCVASCITRVRVEIRRPSSQCGKNVGTLDWKRRVSLYDFIGTPNKETRPSSGFCHHLKKHNFCLFSKVWTNPSAARLKEAKFAKESVFPNNRHSHP